MVSFTGGLETGKRIMATAAATVKKVALELGGKNPNVVFADADFETAVDFALTAVFLHSGQVCSAGARLIVEDSLHDAFVDEVVRRARQIRLGGPFDPEAETGPLISAQHREKVEAYVAAGLAEGAVLRCGGAAARRPRARRRPLLPADRARRVPPGHARGARGVLRPRAHRGALHATRTTPYASPTTPSTDSPEPCGRRTPGKAQRVARRLRHGTVWINDYHPYVPQAEWGGFGHSGVGRELGPTGLDEYREPKHIWQNIQPRPQHWFRG